MSPDKRESDKQSLSFKCFVKNNIICNSCCRIIETFGGDRIGIILVNCTDLKNERSENPGLTRDFRFELFLLLFLLSLLTDTYCAVLTDVDRHLMSRDGEPPVWVVR